DRPAAALGALHRRYAAGSGGGSWRCDGRCQYQSHDHRENGVYRTRRRHCRHGGGAADARAGMSPDKDPLSGLAYAYGGPLARARVRAEPEDFQVFETLSFVPSGRGEHLFLRVRKRQWTTEAAAAALARALGVRRDQGSSAGMKDKQALTEQWFSVHLPGRGLELPLGELERGLWLVEATRNDRKLRRGALAGNRFRLLLRELDNNSTTALGARLVRIAWAGVPNYFGVQRFGRDGD